MVNDISPSASSASSTSSTPSNPGLQPGTTTGSHGGAATGHSANAPELLHDMAQGAHQTIDRLAEQVTPHVQRLQESMASTTEMLDEQADQMREMADEWMASLRCAVRDHPLAAVGAALALGVLVARLSR